ncbi:TPA: hypothetical protein ACTYAG_001433 [Citrobacter freundii]
MNLIEMEGFLRGKCLPGDIKTGESNAEYLVRKFSELHEQLSESQREFRSADITMQNLEAQLKQSKIDADCYKKGMEASNARLVQLAAENAGMNDFVKTCFRAAADGASLDGADIQELGERLGLFGRETYQPALHGYICGHEAGEDTVYVMKKTPATGAFLAEVRAQARTDFIDRIEWIIRNECNPEKTETIINELQAFAAQIRKGAEL